MIRGRQVGRQSAITRRVSRTFVPVALILGATGVASSSAAALATARTTVASALSKLGSDGAGYCFVTSGGGAKCWGANLDGALGDGDTASTAHSAVSVKNLKNATSITGDLNNNGYCAILRGGTVKCWGYNGSGQLGAHLTAMSSDVPVTVSGLSGVTSLVSDGFSFCALLSTGGARCWGYDFYGQLGDGGFETDSAVPVSVKGLTGATALVTDFNNGYCALVRDGAAKCWGYNVSGALGDGADPTITPSSNVPVTVSGLSDAKSLASDRYGYCALLGTGSAKCWGYNADGELGAGISATNSATPVTVLGLSNATSITGDGNGFGVYCAITSAGGAKCWGNNGPGTLGNGSTVTSSNTPVSVSGLSNAVALVSGGASFCALLHSGTAECWGSNSYGQLGSGQSAIDSNTPVSVESLGGATTLTTDDTGYCALSSHGVKCWGYNLYGQLGNGNKELSSASPVSVNGLS